jgi:spore germination cell wall hydrolase CwlJ-like protein
MMGKLKTVVTCLAVMMGSASNAGPNTYSRSDLECLIMNVYYESRGEDFKGKMAVAYTTLNRVKSDLFPDNICDVVWQKNQFSWTSNDDLVINKTEAEWFNSALAAIIALYKPGGDLTNGALFFHANYIVKPSWAKKMEITLKHGGHTFYAL